MSVQCLGKVATNHKRLINAGSDLLFSVNSLCFLLVSRAEPLLAHFNLADGDLGALRQSCCHLAHPVQAPQSQKVRR